MIGRQQFRHQVMYVAAVVAAATMTCVPNVIAQNQSDGGQAATAAYNELMQTQAGLDQPYLLGRGDAISVLVEGRPELTGKHVIGPDGNITLPMVGSLNIVDKTRDQAAEIIKTSLLTYYTHPVVAVAVDAYTSNRILLVGAIERPGPLTFDHPPTLLEVLVHGGNVLSPQSSSQYGYGGGYGGRSLGSAESLPEKCVIYRGTQTAISLDLKGLLESGNSLANLRLKRDDVVYVPSQNGNYISVLGQVQRPGSQRLEKGTTLARLLSDAGGLTNQAGLNPKLRIVEPSTGKEREIEFKALLNPKASEIPLHSGDIVYVPMSGFNNFAYSLERLSPLISVFTTASILGQR